MRSTSISAICRFSALRRRFFRPSRGARSGVAGPMTSISLRRTNRWRRRLARRASSEDLSAPTSPSGERASFWTIATTVFRVSASHYRRVRRLPFGACVTKIPSQYRPAVQSTQPGCGPLVDLLPNARDRTVTTEHPDETSARHLPTREGYDLWAEVYDTDGNPLLALEERHIGTLIGDVAGLAIADVGCGTGRHAVRLAAAGARVTALDFSDRMLEAARRKPGAESIRFVEHDITRALPLPDAAFDRVLCCLVMEHVADLPALFRELRRVCREAPRGAIVVSVMHPAMLLRGVQARFNDPHTGVRTQPASLPYQVSDYVTAALGAGLSLEHLSEHAVDEALATEYPRGTR